MSAPTVTMTYSATDGHRDRSADSGPGQRAVRCTSTRLGRPSMIPTPDVSPSPAWDDAWLGFELAQLSLGRAPSTIKNRRSIVTIMARHATAAGIEPSAVTRQWLQKYMLAQVRERKNSGAATAHQDLKVWWDWYAAEYEVASPFGGIARPKVTCPAPPVLTPAQFRQIMDACSGRDFLSVRNRAVVLLLMESGLRRFELSALEPADVDLKARTVTVRRGKGGRARVSVFGDDTAAALHRWLRKRGDGPGTLFLNVRGERLTPSGVGTLLHQLGDAAGVPGLRPHLFRHAWTHYSLEDGMREHDIMKLAGWTTGKQLERYGASMAEQRAISAGHAHSVARAIKGK
jgi:site-specific recombinase XerD